MKNRIVAALIVAGLMSVAASEEGVAPETPVSLRPVVPVDVKTEPKTEPKAEVKVDPKTPVKTESLTGWDRYKVLVQRNMFSKERGRPREEVRTERKRDVPPPPRIESDLVLIGVVQKDGAPAAIIENRVSGKIVAVKPGDSIGAGAIKVISLDSIDFECDGILNVIKIGSTLAGTAPKTFTVTTPETSASTTTPGGTSTPPATTTSTTPAATGTPPTGTGAGGGESVLERMRRKRQEELRK